MKLIVACVFTNSGIAKESKNPYSMTRALVLSPFADVENSNFQSRGEGFTAVELSVSAGVSTNFQNSFHAVFKGMPIEMDVTTALDRDGRNVITGLVSPVAMSKVG